MIHAPAAARFPGVEKDGGKGVRMEWHCRLFSMDL